MESLFYGFIAIIEISIVVGVFILNYLTSIKGGVMRHVYSRKIQYGQSIYSEALLKKQSILAILFTISFAVIFIYAVKHRKSLLLKFELIVSLAISLSLILVINLEFFISMMSYPYFIMACEIIILLQLLIVISLLFKERVDLKTSK